MNVTLTSLEALILKATHESLPQPDAAAVEAFCAVMRDSAEGAQLAAQALAARIHSQQAKEALLALTMLDRCMRRCDSNFHAEIGKFRFLNEMIKLVSPKYLADRTSPKVRTRVLQLIHAWSIEYSKESKFKVAFDMLKNQGVIKETPPPLPPEDVAPITRARAKSAIFEDEEKSKLLQKLLQSKKPEDLQHANRLIKTMVREEERRTEASSRRAQEVSAALDSAGLLYDMLEHASDASTDEEQLIHELHSSCLRLRPVLQHLATNNNESDNLSDILHASDVLEAVFEKYKIFVEKRKDKTKNSTDKEHAPNSDALLDFAGTDLRDRKATVKSGNSTMDDLGDIFSNETVTKNIADPIKPVSLVTNEDVELLDEKNKKVEGWSELDSLGERLLKQSLPENAKRLDSFNVKNVKKIPMNALEKVSLQEQQSTGDTAILDLDFFTKKPEETLTLSPAPSSKPTTPNDDVMVDISSDANGSQITNNNKVINSLNNILDLSLPLESDANVNTNTKEENKKRVTNTEIKSLTGINVTLDSVHPSQLKPMTVFEEEGGVTVVLHFCKDEPRPGVNVIVISTTSRNTSPIEDYKFQGVVSKGCKVRLLTPSGTALPAFNPFLPPPALTQVMIIAKPPAQQINLRFIITYTCNDEMCSEMGEANLPLDNI